MMARWTGEEVFEGLEKWLKTRRDEADSDALVPPNLPIDTLLNEVRDLAAEGWLPWQKLGSEADE